jgi:hypothetical protein
VRGLLASLTSLVSLLVGGMFVLLTAIFSLSDLISVTGGRAALMAEAFAVACLACAATAAAMILVLLGGERLQRRAGAPASPRPSASPGRWTGGAAVLAWTAFITSPFLAPSVVAGDWLETVRLVLLAGGLITAVLAAIMLWAVLAGAGKPGR